jgi:hypothetical protein
MGALNPHYDPNWAEVMRACAEDAARWQAVCAAVAEQDGFGAPRHRAALAQQAEAAKRAEVALWTQHRTVAEYAAWKFGMLAAPQGAGLVHDLDGFESIEAVNAAFARARAQLLEPVMVDEVSLPVRQPAGLLAFADAQEVLVSPRRFAQVELAPHARAGEGDYLDCMVSVHQTGGEIHFCIAHRWGELSPGAGDQFRNIATLLARQALAFLHPGAEVLFGGGNHASPAHRELIKQVNASAATLRFYRHMLPRRDLKEQFCRVDMAWDGAKWLDPDWSAAIYDSLPAALRDAAASGF